MQQDIGRSDMMMLRVALPPHSSQVMTSVLSSGYRLYGVSHVLPVFAWVSCGLSAWCPVTGWIVVDYCLLFLE